MAEPRKSDRNSIGTPSRNLEDGFSLVELALVLVVFGILVAIAVPTFLATRERANDRAAQSQARTALEVQQTHAMAAPRPTGAGALVADLAAAEPSIHFDEFDAAAQVKGVVYVKLEAGDVVKLVSRSASGKCFWTRDDSGITTYATTKCPVEPTERDFGRSW
jgi:type IV pilus assembly protein PilA